VSQQSHATIVTSNNQPGCLISVLWFIFIGSWLSFFWILIAWALTVLIVTMPIGIAMMHRVPRIATLRAPSREYLVATEGTATRIQEIRTPQRPFIIRAIYFVLIGWWLSFVWVIVAWATTATIVLLPLSIWMMNRIPAVTTLQRY
jgi:uncharacterized membrane protein YccF (DUF307 family)